MQDVSFDKCIAKKFEHVERERSDMHGYQNEDYEFLKNNPFSFALLDMGLGKTVTGATVVADMLTNLEHDGKVLIVGPIAVIASSWPDEFSIWRHLACLNYTVLREDDADPRLKAARKAARAAGENESKAETAERHKIRAELARSSPSIHLINYEGIEWLIELHGRNWPYRTVLLDESSMIKNHTSNRFKALARVRLTPGLITRMHLFTATPASETYEHLFAQTYLLDLGQRFGKHITHFREKYFTQNRYTLKWKLRPGAEEEILAKLADIATIRKRADHFDVKEPRVIHRKVTLTTAETALYEQLAKEFIVTLDDGTEIEAVNAAALTQKLSQLASGVLYETYLDQPEGFDPDADPDADPEDNPDLIKVKRVHHVHDHKIEMLKEVVEELDGEPVLVAYQHRATLDRLKKAFPKAVQWDKQGKAKAAWNARKIPMLLMHPRSGGHGNNLQKGGHNIVFFDIPWSREQLVQLIGRLDRQGQVNHVTVIMLIAKNTVDETIAQAQRDKKDAEEELFRILKRMIAKYRAAKAKEEL